MRPNRGYVLVAPVETSETFDGGTIILPQSVREGMAAYQCTVLAIGLPEICEDKKCQRPHGEWPPVAVEPWRPFKVTYLPEALTHPIPPELVVGAWVLVKPRCFIDSAHPTETQYFVHINNIEAVFVQSTEASAEVT